jgi:ATP-dependent protease ClpP protease subunit
MERDNFMSPTEALEFGLIDRILTRPDENSNLEKSDEKK